MLTFEPIWCIIVPVAKRYDKRKRSDKGNGSIAQLGEHLPYKQRVIGSSPIVPTTFGPVVQLVRTLACHARGRRFEPVPGRQFFASVAQSVEQGTENPRVDGSIPSGGTKNADVAHLVERHLAKVEVAGSSPVIRSKSKVSVTQMLFYFAFFLYCQGARRRPLRKCSGGAFLGRALMRVRVTHRKQLARQKPLHQTIPVIRSIKSVQLMY